MVTTKYECFAIKSGPMFVSAATGASMLRLTQLNSGCARTPMTITGNKVSDYTTIPENDRSGADVQCPKTSMPPGWIPESAQRCTNDVCSDATVISETRNPHIGPDYMAKYGKTKRNLSISW